MSVSEDIRSPARAFPRKFRWRYDVGVIIATLTIGIAITIMMMIMIGVSSSIGMAATAISRCCRSLSWGSSAGPRGQAPRRCARRLRRCKIS
jgi:hypothetical protein